MPKGKSVVAKHNLFYMKLKHNFISFWKTASQHKAMIHKIHMPTRDKTYHS
jgi:hypothetical protein